VPVARLGLDANERRLVAWLYGLQRRHELERVSRYYAIVVIGGGDDRRWVADASLDVVYGRIFANGLKLRRVARRSILGNPANARAELVVAQHVHHTRSRIRDGEQVRTLFLHRTDEQAAIGIPVNRQVGRRRVLLLYEIFGCANEIVEYVLLFVEHAGAMPCVAVLAATANVRQCVDATMLQPYGDVGAETRRVADVEATVCVQDR